MLSSTLTFQSTVWNYKHTKTRLYTKIWLQGTVLVNMHWWPHACGAHRQWGTQNTCELKFPSRWGSLQQESFRGSGLKGWVFHNHPWTMLQQLYGMASSQLRTLSDMLVYGYTHLKSLEISVYSTHLKVHNDRWHIVRHMSLIRSMAAKCFRINVCIKRLFITLAYKDQCKLFTAPLCCSASSICCPEILNFTPHRG